MHTNYKNSPTYCLADTSMAKTEMRNMSIDFSEAMLFLENVCVHVFRYAFFLRINRKLSDKEAMLRMCLWWVQDFYFRVLFALFFPLLSAVPARLHSGAAADFLTAGSISKNRGRGGVGRDGARAGAGAPSIYRTSVSTSAFNGDTDNCPLWELAKLSKTRGRQPASRPPPAPRIQTALTTMKPSVRLLSSSSSSA